MSKAELVTVPIDRPEIFDVRAMPEQPKVLKPGQLEASKIKEFFEKGFLVVPKFFKEEELEPCKRSLEKMVDNLAQKLYDGGKIQNLYKEQGLFTRLTKIEEQFPGANIILHKQREITEAFQNLWSNERLLNVIEQLIGPEIAGHPVLNIRTKTPQNEATTVPWHQDSAYLDNDSYNVLQATAWIPFLDTDEKNGCMEVLSGGHLPGKIVRHTCCWGDTWYIVMDEEDAAKKLRNFQLSIILSDNETTSYIAFSPPYPIVAIPRISQSTRNYPFTTTIINVRLPHNVDLIKDNVLCPVPYGGMLLINNMIPHRSLNNVSDEIRWSVDLRWQTPEKPVGFYGIKDGVLMRSAKNPVTKIDWETFNSVDRCREAEKKSRDQVPEDPFDTIIVGPWMKKWEMTHTNRHTDRLLSRNDSDWQQA